MANHFYVRDHADGTGTGVGSAVDSADGVYTTRQTGDWDTTFTTTPEYYASLEAVFAGTVTPVSGDFIYGSDIHSHSYSATKSIGGPSSGASLTLVSVDDTSMAVSKVGVSEIVTGGANDFTITGQWMILGLTMQSNDDVGSAGNDSGVTFVVCTLIAAASGDSVVLGATGAYTVCISCEFKLNNAAANISVSSAGHCRIFGGSVTTTSGGVTAIFSNLVSSNLLVQGLDLTAVSGSGSIVATGASSTDDSVYVRFEGCPITSGATFLGETIDRSGVVLEAVNCASSSAAAEYQFYKEMYAGTVEDQDDTGIFRNESTAFPSGTQVSMKVTSSANCSLGDVLWFDFPAQYAELSGASTDTIQIYFAITNATTLTDTNVWAELIYPDGTNNHIYNFLSNRNADILATGTTHTDDSASSTWKNGAGDLASHNEYRMDLDTSGDVGADSVPIIRIYVAIASATIYFDTSVGVVA